MINGMVGVIIWTERADAMVSFYHDTIGLTLHSSRPDFVSFKWGGMRLSIGTHSKVRGKTPLGVP